MDANEISKLVEFTDTWVSEKTGQHLETVEKEILRQTLKGKKLSSIEFPSYENSYVQRYRAPQLWKQLSYVAGEKVGKKTVLEVLQRLQLQRSASSCTTATPLTQSADTTQSQFCANTQIDLNGHTALNGSVSCLELRDGKPISEELDAIKPDEPTPYQTGVSDYINLNATNGKIPNHLNFFSTRLLIKGQLGESSQTKASQSKKVEDCSAGSTAQEFQLSSQTSQSDNPEPNVDSNTDGWHSFMNFMKPGMPLLLALGVFGCLFALSWLANWYGATHYLTGQLPKAQFGYSLALKLNPFSAAAHYNQGTVYEDQHNYQRAHAEYQMAIEGGLIEAYNNQARLYILEGNYDAAVSLLRIGLPLAKDDRVKADMYKNQGWARLEQGRYAEAKLDLTEAIKLKSESAPAYCLLAQVLEREEDKKAALEHWENCLGFAYQPNTPEEDQWIHLARQRLSAEGG